MLWEVDKLPGSRDSLISPKEEGVPFAGVVGIGKEGGVEGCRSSIDILGLASDFGSLLSKGSTSIGIGPLMSEACLKKRFVLDFAELGCVSLAMFRPLTRLIPRLSLSSAASTSAKSSFDGSKDSGGILWIDWLGLAGFSFLADDGAAEPSRDRLGDDSFIVPIRCARSSMEY